MLRGVIITPDPNLRDQLEQLFRPAGRVLHLRSFDEWLDPQALTRFARAHAPQVFFLDFRDLDRALDFARHLRQTVGGVFPVAVAPSVDPSVLMRMMREGIRELLYPPFESALFQEAMDRIEEALKAEPIAQEHTDLVYSFMPAKPGDGASIAAVYTALALSRLPDAGSLLIDLDRHCGMARFLLKLQHGFSTWDALEKAAGLDPNLWGDLVAHSGPLEVLAAGDLRKPLENEGARVRHLIDFCRHRYRTVCLDLSGQMEEIALEAMLESRRVFLVCTPTLPSIYMAREKIRWLRAMELEDRAGVLLTQWHKTAPLTMSSIEEVLGLPIQHTFPEDRESVNEAMLGGRAVDPATELGREFSQFAYTLAEPKLAVTASPKKRMVEYFTLSPGRYMLMPGK